MGFAGEGVAAVHYPLEPGGSIASLSSLCHHRLSLGRLQVKQKLCHRGCYGPRSYFEMCANVCFSGVDQWSELYWSSS